MGFGTDASSGGASERFIEVAPAATITPNFETTDILLIGSLADPVDASITIANPSADPSRDRHAVRMEIWCDREVAVTFGDKYFETTVSAPATLLPGINRIQFVWVEDTDTYDFAGVILDAPAPTVAFADTTVSFDEDDDEATLTVALTGGPSRFDIVVQVTYSGDAVEDTDYENAPASVTIPAGDTEADLVIPLLDDEDTDGDVELIATLGTPSYATLGVADEATVTIIDNEESGDPDANDWNDRVIGNGGTVSAGTQAAVDAFVVAAKAHGYWSKFTRLNLLCGDQWAAASVPLIVGSGAATDTSAGSGTYGDGDYSEAVGLTAVNSRGLTTGMYGDDAPATQHSVHLSAYLRTARSQTVALDHYMGATTNGSVGVNCNFSLDGEVHSGLYNLDGYNWSGMYDAGAGKMGMCGVNRSSDIRADIYRNGSSVANRTTASTSDAAHRVLYYCGDNNSTGLVTGTQTGSIWAAMSAGLSLTSGEWADYNTDMQAFQTALGRNVTG